MPVRAQLSRRHESQTGGHSDQQDWNPNAARGELERASTAQAGTGASRELDAIRPPSTGPVASQAPGSEASGVIASALSAMKPAVVTPQSVVSGSLSGGQAWAPSEPVDDRAHRKDSEEKCANEPRGHEQIDRRASARPEPG